MEEDIKDSINILEQKITELENEKTVISLREYHELIKGLDEYEKIKELKPIAEIMKRAIDKLTVWV